MSQVKAQVKAQDLGEGYGSEKQSLEFKHQQSLKDTAERKCHLKKRFTP